MMFAEFASGRCSAEHIHTSTTLLAHAITVRRLQVLQLIPQITFTAPTQSSKENSDTEITGIFALHPYYLLGNCGVAVLLFGPSKTDTRNRNDPSNTQFARPEVSKVGSHSTAVNAALSNVRRPNCRLHSAASLARVREAAAGHVRLPGDTLLLHVRRPAGAGFSPYTSTCVNNLGIKSHQFNEAHASNGIGLTDEGQHSIAAFLSQSGVILLFTSSKCQNMSTDRKGCRPMSLSNEKHESGLFSPFWFKSHLALPAGRFPDHQVKSISKKLSWAVMFQTPILVLYFRSGNRSVDGDKGKPLRTHPPPRLVTSSGTIPTCEHLGNEPGSPRLLGRVHHHGPTTTRITLLRTGFDSRHGYPGFHTRGELVGRCRGPEGFLTTLLFTSPAHSATAPTSPGLICADAQDLTFRAIISRYTKEPSPLRASIYSLVFTQRFSFRSPLKRPPFVIPCKSSKFHDIIPDIFTSGNCVGRCRWWAGFLGKLPVYPALAFQCCSILNPISPSSALKTSLLTAAQIFQLNSSRLIRRMLTDGTTPSLDVLQVQCHDDKYLVRRVSSVNISRTRPAWRGLFRSAQGFAPLIRNMLIPFLPWTVRGDVVAVLLQGEPGSITGGVTRIIVYWKRVGRCREASRVALDATEIPRDEGERDFGVAPLLPDGLVVAAWASARAVVTSCHLQSPPASRD
ncbi:hypothetical protein PR048_002642 [Dryococelus australis]|uniref:Uncharacterized protein n=1 Tax=Dryococelus australis TaxID=614101 RepID=A0ABQ9IKW5_9NEOP|nr:hypothetical protein PR048_002642 [Dryococelus australis]